MRDVLAIIERETGYAVTGETRVEDLGLDSLEYLQLLIELDTPADGEYETVSDLMKVHE